MACQDLHSSFDQVGFCFSLLSFKISLYVLDKPFIKYVFFSFSGLSSLSLDIVFPREPVFNSVKFSLSSISFTNHVFGVIWKNVLPYSRSSRFSAVVLQELSVLCFTFRSTVSFNFCEGYKCVSWSFFLFVLGSFTYQCSFVPAS